jgi:hypothetical protein
MSLLWNTNIVEQPWVFSKQYMLSLQWDLTYLHGAFGSLEIQYSPNGNIYRTKVG